MLVKRLYSCKCYITGILLLSFALVVTYYEFNLEVKQQINTFTMIGNRSVTNVTREFAQDKTTLNKLEQKQEMTPPTHADYDDLPDNKTNSHSSPAKSQNFSFRIQFIKDGRCIGISDTGNLVVKFCDPQQNDTFVFVDGKIKSETLSLCFGLDQVNSSLVVLLDCIEAIKFRITDGRLMGEKETGDKQCISVYSYNNEESKWEIPSRNHLGARLGFTKDGCLNKKSSRFELMNDSSFLKDRAALMLPLPETSINSCNYSACGINKPVPLVKALPISQIDRCTNLSHCVTIVTKTARRPLFVIRLAKSLRERLKIDLPMVVIDDDGPKPYKPEIMDEIAKFPNMKYVISSPDLGIAAGRTMGLEMVKTKYFMNLDDDVVATEDTDIAKIVVILDSTDASLVGGGTNFAGFLNFGRNEAGGPTLEFYQGACRLANQSLPGFSNCFRCEITSNIFIARTQDALSVGGWSKELKIVEHKDFFLRLKAAGKKVVHCPDFRAKNVHSNVGVEFVGGMKKAYNTVKYYYQRIYRVQTMMRKFCNHWNIQHIQVIKNKVPRWIDDQL